jgi:predicted RNA-binding Zn-ribbon protein involved in translation (DUF1610 family)
VAETPTILDGKGRPARKAVDTLCPQCGAGEEKREASSGFGTPHTQCGRCGYEWKDLVWRG